MQEQVKRFEQLQHSIRDAIQKLGVAEDESRLQELDAQMQAADFWQDPTAAAVTSSQAATLRKHVEAWRKLEQETAEALELARLGDRELAGEIEASLARLEQQWREREFELKLSGPHDKSSAILALYAGTGGTDAQDWTQMLERMYLRYCERAGFSAEVLEESPGEEAGIKSATIEINGPYAYGKLKSEAGVHRLVRLSPYNSDNLRQTSFAKVEVLPQLEARAELAIDPKDLRIDVYRAGGHGGQSVNTTDSAVRLTHLPTGLVVSIQNERSQLQNKEKAMQILQAKLAIMMAEQHKARVDELRTAPRDAAWGNQIRSYVLHPYTKVKDHRTGHETSAAAEVLEGALDPFIEAYLFGQIGEQSKQK